MPSHLCVKFLDVVSNESVEKVIGDADISKEDREDLVLLIEQQRSKAYVVVDMEESPKSAVGLIVYDKNPTDKYSGLGIPRSLRIRTFMINNSAPTKYSKDMMSYLAMKAIRACASSMHVLSTENSAPFYRDNKFWRNTYLMGLRLDLKPIVLPKASRRPPLHPMYQASKRQTIQLDCCLPPKKRLKYRSV